MKEMVFLLLRPECWIWQQRSTVLFGWHRPSQLLWGQETKNQGFLLAEAEEGLSWSVDYAWLPWSLCQEPVFLPCFSASSRLAPPPRCDLKLLSAVLSQTLQPGSQRPETAGLPRWEKAGMWWERNQALYIQDLIKLEGWARISTHPRLDLTSLI